MHFKTDIYEDIDGIHTQFWKRTPKNKILLLIVNYNVTVFGDESEFDLRYTFPEKAVTGKVCSGAWAIYSEPDFKGKVLYQVGSESSSFKTSHLAS